jgi:apoptosis-inducing factor 3
VSAGGGILVDAYLRTSDPHIHAIGDVACYPDPRLGHRIRVEHWVVAQRMGQWLARTWLGLETDAYDAVPFFWSGQFDLNLRYVGHASDTDDRIIDGEPAAKDVAIVFREDGADQALLTCGRDRQSLQTEAEWEAR